MSFRATQDLHRRPTTAFLSAKYNELADTFPSFRAQVSRKRYISLHLNRTEHDQ